MIKSIWLILVVPATSTVKRKNRQGSPEVDEMKHETIADREPERMLCFEKRFRLEAILFGAGVVGLDLFTNWIEDETLFQKPWQGDTPRK